MLNYILLAGIHGVGKSTLLDKIIKAYPIDAYTISSLIKDASTKNTIDTDKRTELIGKNQHLWKEELKKIKPSSPKIVLDGHFSLLNSQGDIVALPLNTFEGINISGVILKQERPEIIQSRLLQRDNSSWDIEKIKLFQDTEEESAKEYSVASGTPLFIYDTDKLFDELIGFINKR